VTSIYVSHRLPEIFRLLDTVTVLRDGQHVATKPSASSPKARWCRHGSQDDRAYFPVHLKEPRATIACASRTVEPGQVRRDFLLPCAPARCWAWRDWSAGRTEVSQALFGLDPQVSGRLFVRGKPIEFHHPHQAMARQLGLVPEDRKRHGLVLSMKRAQNTRCPP